MKKAREPNIPIIILPLERGSQGRGQGQYINYGVGLVRYKLDLNAKAGMHSGDNKIVGSLPVNIWLGTGPDPGKIRVFAWF
jgi:hypothetical protein